MSYSFCESERLLDREIAALMARMSFVGRHGTNHPRLSGYVSGQKKNQTSVVCLHEGRKSDCACAIFEVTCGTVQQDDVSHEEEDDCSQLERTYIRVRSVSMCHEASQCDVGCMLAGLKL